MKLNEIINHKNLVRKSPLSPDDRYALGDDPDVVGLGQFSTVVKNKEDPHMVNKYHDEPASKTDGFVAYAEMVVEYKLWENIHFPRIYETHTQASDDSDEEFKDYVMEKLVPYNKLPLPTLIGLYNRYFYGKEVSQPDSRDNGNKAKNEVVTKITNALKALVTGNRQATIKINDPEMENAIKTLKELHQKLPFDLDLHPLNLLYRLTSSGPQLVFADPFGESTG